MRIVSGLTALLGAGLLVAPKWSAPEGPYDIILRHGLIIDGTGAPRFTGDIAIRGGRIARVDNLAGARATTEIDATGLMVTPGFINTHSHASPAALPTAENMLTQGVTTEPLRDGKATGDVEGAPTTVTLAVERGASVQGKLAGKPVTILPAARKPAGQ